MIEEIKMCDRHGMLVDGRKTIKFMPSINVVIGPNGSGKSSLLSAVYECGECRKKQSKKTAFHYYNGEMMNPHKNEDIFKGLEGSLIRLRAMFSSHGQTMRDVLCSINFNDTDCLLLDEPETGQDLKWIIKIKKGLDDIAKKGCQIIIASHHPVFWYNSNIIELKRGYKKHAVKTLGNILLNKEE